jgi:large exoprotein involved in heme utilization and adhesion
MLTLNTDRLLVQAGGTINTTTIGDGSAGSLVINARKSIDIDGRGIQFSAPSSVGAFGFRFTDEQPKDPKLLAPLAPTGTSGNTIIMTEQLNVTNGARIDVSNAGTGPAGTLQIRANSIFLDNQAGITASTASGEGGNIQLQVRDLLLLRDNSGVFAIAGGTGNGGNVTIDASSIVAIPRENSDIRADSVNARGGNVTINTSGLFGIEFRDRNTPLSDITATGASSELSGSVEINVQDVDPAGGLTQLPTDVVDASGAIAQGCRDVQSSSFVVSGRGGLPPTPEQSLGDDPRWRDWRTPAVVNRQPNAPEKETLLPSANPPSTKSALMEATGWVMEADGKVILTATAPNVTSPHRWGQPVNCNGS